MAKQRIQKKKPRKTIDGAKETKKFFTITAVIVVVLLIVIYVVTN